MREILHGFNMVSSSLTGLHGEMEQALTGPAVQALGVWSPVLESPSSVVSVRSVMEVGNYILQSWRNWVLRFKCIHSDFDSIKTMPSGLAWTTTNQSTPATCTNSSCSVHRVT